MEPKENKEQVKELIESAKEYLAIRSDLIVLQFKKATAELIGQSASSITILIFLTMTFLFGSITLAFYLSEIFHSYTKGFLYLSIGYFVLTLIALLLRKSIRNGIVNTMIKLLFKTDEDE